MSILTNFVLQYVANMQNNIENTDLNPQLHSQGFLEKDEMMVSHKKVDFRKFDYPEKGDRPVTVKEVTFQIESKDRREVVLQTLVQNDHLQKETEDGESISYLFIGGGVSDSGGNSGVAFGRIADAIENQYGLPKSYNMIAMSHIAGSARRAKPQDGKEKAYETFAENAEILEKALNVPELNCQGKIVLIGYSAGGKQAIELAARLGDRVKLLILADSAGVANHPDLGFQISMGTMADGYRKYRKKGYSRILAVHHAISDAGRTWVTPDGPASSLIKFAREWTPHAPQRLLTGKLADTYMIPRDERAKISADMEEISKETPIDTRKNIKASIIFAPILYAHVVNVMQEIIKNDPDFQPSKMKGKLADISNIRDELILIGEKSIHEIFPEAQVVFSPGESYSHSDVMIDENKYWDKLMKVASEVLKTN